MSKTDYFAALLKSELGEEYDLNDTRFHLGVKVRRERREQTRRAEASRSAPAARNGKPHRPNWNELH